MSEHQMSKPQYKCKLNFGIELEVLVKLPKEIAKLNFVDINKKIKRLSFIIKKKLPNINIEFSKEKEIDDYSVWHILKDDSLVCDKNFLAFEIISPIITNKKVQFKELKKILNVLKKFDVCVNGSCGFHLHLSQKEEPFTLEQIKNICKIFLTFEDSLDNINPERKNNMYCQSNRYNINLKDSSLDECFTLINNCNSMFSLVHLINPINKNTEMYQTRGKGEHYGSWYRNQRFYKLNLTNILNQKETIEIRSHSGTTDYSDIIDWVETWETLFNVSKYFQ
tara:strand:- start:1512 stop:2351 length:840 start_codon:yes stop_codon:yes gene_type:complete